MLRLAGGPAGSGVKRPDGAWLLYQPYDVVSERWGGGFAACTGPSFTGFSPTS